MATRLGDASIKIVIDPSDAKDQLDKLSAEIERLKSLADQARDKGIVEDANKERKKKTESQRPGQKFLDQLLGQYKIAADLLEQSGLLGTTIAEATRGTFFEDIGKQIEEKLNELSAEVVKLRSQIDTVGATAHQTAEFNVAALHLGGKFPDDQVEVVKQIHELASHQVALTRNMDAEMKREFMRLFFGGIKEALGGGK